MRIPAALLLFASLTVHAQPSAQVHRVGYVSTESGPTFEAFRKGLRELGYIEGKNVLIEARFADGLTERLPGLVAEVIARRVDVLLAGSPAGAVAAKNASTTLPIVFAGVGDPVASGVVASLARPGRNITGIAVGVGGSAFGGKWLEALKEAVPGLTQVAVLANRSNASNSPYIKGVEDSGRRLKIKVEIFDAGNDKELERALAAVGASGAQGMIVTTDPFLFRSRAALIRFAESRRLPTMYFFKLFTEGGGLMSYGASIEDSYQRAAVYVDKILKGAKPGDLPVEQPTRFELAINLKTAKALGLRIPQSLLLRADSVIE